MAQQKPNGIRFSRFFLVFPNSECILNAYLNFAFVYLLLFCVFVIELGSCCWVRERGARSMKNAHKFRQHKQPLFKSLEFTIQRLFVTSIDCCHIFTFFNCYRLAEYWKRACASVESLSRDVMNKRAKILFMQQSLVHRACRQHEVCWLFILSLVIANEIWYSTFQRARIIGVVEWKASNLAN